MWILNVLYVTRISMSRNVLCRGIDCLLGWVQWWHLNFCCGGHWGGKNEKICRKWLIFTIFSLWLGSKWGAEPATERQIPPLLDATTGWVTGMATRWANFTHFFNDFTRDFSPQSPPHSTAYFIGNSQNILVRFLVALQEQSQKGRGGGSAGGWVLSTWTLPVTRYYRHYPSPENPK